MSAEFGRTLVRELPAKCFIKAQKLVTALTPPAPAAPVTSVPPHRKSPTFSAQSDHGGMRTPPTPQLSHREYNFPPQYGTAGGGGSVEMYGGEDQLFLPHPDDGAKQEAEEELMAGGAAFISTPSPLFSRIFAYARIQFAEIWIPSYPRIDPTQPMAMQPSTVVLAFRSSSCISGAFRSHDWYRPCLQRLLALSPSRLDSPSPRTAAPPSPPAVDLLLDPPFFAPPPSAPLPTTNLLSVPGPAPQLPRPLTTPAAPVVVEPTHQQVGTLRVSRLGVTARIVLSDMYAGVGVLLLGGDSGAGGRRSSRRRTSGQRQSRRSSRKRNSGQKQRPSSSQRVGFTSSPQQGNAWLSFNPAWTGPMQASSPTSVILDPVRLVPVNSVVPWFDWMAVLDDPLLEPARVSVLLGAELPPTAELIEGLPPAFMVKKKLLSVYPGSRMLGGADGGLTPPLTPAFRELDSAGGEDKVPPITKDGARPFVSASIKVEPIVINMSSDTVSSVKPLTLTVAALVEKAQDVMKDCVDTFTVAVTPVDDMQQAIASPSSALHKALPEAPRKPSSTQDNTPRVAGGGNTALLPSAQHRSSATSIPSLMDRSKGGGMDAAMGPPPPPAVPKPTKTASPAGDNDGDPGDLNDDESAGREGNGGGDETNRSGDADGVRGKDPAAAAVEALMPILSQVTSDAFTIMVSLSNHAGDSGTAIGSRRLTAAFFTDPQHRT